MSCLGVVKGRLHRADSKSGVRKMSKEFACREMGVRKDRWRKGRCNITGVKRPSL